MLRRDFLKQSAAVAALASLPLSCSPIPPASRFAMGLQLYTVRDAMEKDPIGTLKALKEMGYLHFESYGYDAEAKTYYGYEIFIELISFQNSNKTLTCCKRYY